MKPTHVKMMTTMTMIFFLSASNMLQQPLGCPEAVFAQVVYVRII